MTVVYKLTRADGLEYIGIAKNFKSRLWKHKRSERFSELPIIKYEILKEFSNYEDALLFEKHSIDFYNTYVNGLNKTIDGSGNHKRPSFTTRGRKLSEETKKKIQQASIKNQQQKYAQRWYNSLSEEEKRKKHENHSKKTKGKPKPTKIKKEIIVDLFTEYAKQPILNGVNTIQKNGKMLTYDRAFSKKYSKLFGINYRQTYLLITNKVLSWQQLYNEIIGIKS